MAVIKILTMRNLFIILFSIPFILVAQNDENGKDKDTSEVYKKRVLENVELELLGSYYSQTGSNASVTGGIGTEELTDFAFNVVVAIPLNDDDVLTIDATISAYTSASSSNLNPFPIPEEEGEGIKPPVGPVTGTPWAASSGASKSDTWKSGVVGYSHSSDDRNSIYHASVSFSTEYDYTSFGFGGGFTRLFNQKNTEIGISGKVYLDTWNPKYPIEIIEFIENNGNLNSGLFAYADILDQGGNPIDKNAPDAWAPINNTLLVNKGRNSYSASFSLSQILGKRSQISLFSDVVIQQGWLANPMQRVYFSDKDNFYIGNGASIKKYTDPSNLDVFQLADDIERLPDSRLKIPIGVRYNYYINEYILVRTYYRYYFDDWGINSHTLNVELPIKIGNLFTVYPSYRFYNQTAADYFAPYEQHISTETYYTSDYDLSEFTATQFGLAIQYSDILTQRRLWMMGLKNITLSYNYYSRNTGLKASIISLGATFVFDK